VIAARDAVVRADQAAGQHRPPDPASQHQQLLDRMLSDNQPDPRELVELEAGQRGYELWSGLVREAHEQAVRRLSATIGENRDRIISEHLRPAHAEAVEVAKSLASVAALADDPDVRGALAGTQRKKADQLVEAARRYGATRAAWSALVRGAPTRDESGLFGELYDMDTVWPSWRQHGDDRPWPSTPAARLAWLATHARLWLPLPSEQSERWDEVFGADERQAQRNRHQARALGGAFG